MCAMRVGSLFAGIGGFDLGFERAGFETVWQVEIDEFCRRVLEQHFPKATRYADINDCCGCPIRISHTDNRCVECGRANFLPWVDVITGGFPCQDISFCGQGAGIEGQRSGLWREMHRIICEVRPHYVVVENVAALLKRGIGRVLGDLAASGYDAEWDCFPASAFGFYHERDRVVIVAHSAERNGQPHDLLEAGPEWRSSFQSRRLHSMAVATRAKRENTRLEHEPGLARMVLRVPNQVQRLEALGNTIVPQIAEWIGKRIMECAQ